LAKKSILIESQKDKKYHSGGKYVINKAMVTYWYNVINDEVFGGILPKAEYIEIKRRHGCWGECLSVDPSIRKPYRRFGISLSDYMKSFRHFLKTLAHEMVHAYQWFIHGHMTHGKTFFEWKERLAKFNINLTLSGGRDLTTRDKAYIVVE